MDYSKFYPSITTGYTILLLSSITGIILCAIADGYLIKTYCKEKKWINAIGAAAFIVITIFVIVYSINIIQDIPNIIHKNFIITTGVVVHQDAAGDEPEGRGFSLKRDDTNEIVDINTYYYPIQTGMQLQVMYLPHSHTGAITKIMKKSE